MGHILLDVDDAIADVRWCTSSRSRSTPLILGGVFERFPGLQFVLFDLEALRPAADRFGPTVAKIAEPLTALPDGANQALQRSARQVAEAS